MHNFMIKYECNDAKDNFCTQRKENGNKMPINLYYEDIDDLDTQHYGEDYNEYHEKSEALVTAAEALVEPTSCEITRCSQQKVPATIVNAVGWLDDIEGRPSTKVPKRINFSQDKFASE